MLMQAGRSALLIVDIQERLAPAIADQAMVIARTAMLIDAADALAIPVLASEQYPKGLGPTVSMLRTRLAADRVISKTFFSCARQPEFIGQVRHLGRKQLVVAGMEAHVCVLQTVLELVRQQYEVFAVADAIGSRAPESRALAIERMRAAGASIVTVEMVLFEWLERADRPEFRPLSVLIR